MGPLGKQGEERPISISSAKAACTRVSKLPPPPPVENGLLCAVPSVTFQLYKGALYSSEIFARLKEFSNAVKPRFFTDGGVVFT